MRAEQIVSKVKMLKLETGSFVVYGSGPLAAAGIREAKDIDLLVNKRSLNVLINKGWQQINKGPYDNPYIFENIEVHASWRFSPYNPSLALLLTSAFYVDGVPFAALEEVRKWKSATGGSKHLDDILLIDSYLDSRK